MNCTINKRKPVIYKIGEDNNSENEQLHKRFNVRFEELLNLSENFQKIGSSKFYSNTKMNILNITSKENELKKDKNSNENTNITALKTPSTTIDRFGDQTIDHSEIHHDLQKSHIVVSSTKILNGYDQEEENRLILDISNSSSIKSNYDPEEFINMLSEKKTFNNINQWLFGEVISLNVSPTLRKKVIQVTERTKFETQHLFSFRIVQMCVSKLYKMGKISSDSVCII